MVGSLAEAHSLSKDMHAQPSPCMHHERVTSSMRIGAHLHSLLLHMAALPCRYAVMGYSNLPIIKEVLAVLTGNLVGNEVSPESFTCGLGHTTDC